MCRTDEGGHRAKLLVANSSKCNPIGNTACSHYLLNTVHWFLLKISPNLQYWLIDHILSSLFNKCSMLLGTRQHLSKVGAGGKHNSRLTKRSLPCCILQEENFLSCNTLLYKSSIPQQFAKVAR